MSIDIAEAIIERSKLSDESLILRLSVNRIVVCRFRIEKRASNITISRPQRPDAISVKCERDSHSLLKSIWNTLVRCELLKHQEFAYEDQNALVSIHASIVEDAPAVSFERASMPIKQGDFAIPDSIVAFAASMSDPRVSIVRVDAKN